jgi:peptidoglycan hydrolase CwlO-like protein
LSTLGKILTVLVVLVAVGVAVSVTISVVLNDNWKARYDTEHTNFNLAIDERDSAISQRDTEKSNRLEERGKLQAQVGELDGAKRKGDQEIGALKLDIEGQKKTNTDLATDVNGLKTSLATLLADKVKVEQVRDNAMKTADDLTKQNSDLDVRLREALKNLDNSTEAVRKTAEDLKAAESKLAWIQQNYPDVKLPSVTVPVPPEKIRGLVTRVDSEAKLITINLGEDDGVVAGMKFYVYNGSDVQYLATLVVTMVSKDSSAGELTVIKGPVRVNDHVTNRF